MSIIKCYNAGLMVGSGACSIANDKIKIKLNNHGEYQYFTDNEEELLKAANVCCMSNECDSPYSISEELFSHQVEIKRDKNIGYYHKLYAGYVDEGDYRKNGSSGGMTSWILVELLNR